MLGETYLPFRLHCIMAHNSDWFIIIVVHEIHDALTRFFHACVALSGFFERKKEFPSILGIKVQDLISR